MSKVNSGQAIAAKSLDSLAQNYSKEPYPAPLAPPVSSGGNSTGSAILDTYLQFITENSLGMGMMSSEQAAAAMRAAQMNALSIDKATQQHFLEKMQQQMGVATDLMMMKRSSEEIRRGGEADAMNHERDKVADEGESSGGEEEEYSEEEMEPEAVKAGE